MFHLLALVRCDVCYYIRQVNGVKLADIITRRLDLRVQAKCRCLGNKGTTFCMVPLNRPSPKTPQQAQIYPVYLPHKPTNRRFCANFGEQILDIGGLNQKSKNNVLQRGSWRTDDQKMARFYREIKKKNRFEVRRDRQTDRVNDKKIIDFQPRRGDQ